MSLVIVNPGAGQSAERTTQKQAMSNMRAFRRDLDLPRCMILYNGGSKRGGRYSFALFALGRRCEIEMPGLPTHRVRWGMTGEDQNPWQFPRLFVDGDSWLWKFAVSRAKAKLTGADQ